MFCDIICLSRQNLFGGVWFQLTKLGGLGVGGGEGVASNTLFNYLSIFFVGGGGAQIWVGYPYFVRRSSSVWVFLTPSIILLCYWIILATIARIKTARLATKLPSLFPGL